MQKIITVCSPKGGTGKTTVAQNLLVQFANAGFRVLGVDFDPQQTLSKWAKRREATKNRAFFSVSALDISDWSRLSELAEEYDIIIADLLPGVEGDISSVHDLCRSSSLVVVPTGLTMSDLDSTEPWVKQLQELDVRAVMAMNRANPRESFFAAARNHLNGIGTVCPVEIRQLADAHQFSIDGLAAADKPRCKAYPDFAALFNFVKRESGVDGV